MCCVFQSMFFSVFSVSYNMHLKMQQAPNIFVVTRIIYKSLVSKREAFQNSFTETFCQIQVIWFQNVKDKKKNKHGNCMVW